MKKIYLSILIFTCLFVSTSAFALDLPNRYFTPEDAITIKNGSDGSLILWETSSDDPFLKTGYTNGENINELTTALQYSGNEYIVADVDADSPCYSSGNLTECRSLLPSYKFFTFKGIPTGESYLTAGGFIYSRDGNFKSKASDLVAMAGTATGLTMETMGGIVGVVGGIIMAFGFILYIISLLNETSQTKNKKYKI